MKQSTNKKIDCFDFLRKSRNDERVERFYFWRKPNEAKTFDLLRYAQIFLFGYFATLSMTDKVWIATKILRIFSQ